MHVGQNPDFAVALQKLVGSRSESHRRPTLNTAVTYQRMLSQLHDANQARKRLAVNITRQKIFSGCFALLRPSRADVAVGYLPDGLKGYRQGLDEAWGLLSPMRTARTAVKWRRAGNFLQGKVKKLLPGLWPLSAAASARDATAST